MIILINPNQGYSDHFAGVEGNGDKTKAPHLHFEIRNLTKDPNGKYYLNPALFIELQKYENKEQTKASKTQ